MNSLYAIYALVAISSVQAWSPCRCHLIDNPVCGSDGVTYSNACFLDCAQKKINSSLSMVHEGHCKSQVTLNTCVCTIKYKPVCGSDGVTYDNMCEFRCAKKKNQSLHLERRDKSADVKDYSDDCCVCTMEYNPVCGSDGVTYGNPCVLKCAQVKDANLHVIRDGSCTG